MFDVNPSLLRYWEQEFDILKPHRNKKGNRLFTPKDVDNIRIIYHLLKERKMKIEVARKYIRDYRKEVDRDAEIAERLMNIRGMLLEVKQDLVMGGRVVDDVSEGTEPFEAESDGSVAAVSSVVESAADAVPAITAEETVSADGPVPVSGENQTAQETARPPFEEQMLFEVAVAPGKLAAAEAMEAEQEEPGQAEEPVDEPAAPRRVEAIEQTLF